MNSNQYSSESTPNECKVLLDACTPWVFHHNAFRITGLFTDASVRDIKRRIDDLKHAEEMGNAEDEHSHAFALVPPPGLEQIREAALRLQDPERRIVEEFFWFWPIKWGSGKNDPALLALAKGDKKITYNTWAKSLSNDHTEKNIISKHNLAIMFQMTALDGELINLKKNLNTDSLAKIEKYWRTSFKWWEELTEDEVFWSLISTRIRMLDDPRLTTGFTRRIRATLPEALDKINALLAMQYMEKGKLEFARKHIVYMKETHQGLDNVSKTLAMITQPIQMRIRDAVEKATHIAEQEPGKAAQAANELFETVAQPLEIIRGILPTEDLDRIDLCDTVAETGLACSNANIRIEHDFAQNLAILKEAQEFAESEETRKKITEALTDMESASLLSPVIQVCERVLMAAKDKPENVLVDAQQLLLSSHLMIDRLHASNAPDEIRNRAKDEIAGTLMQCAIIHGNKTEKWEPCIRFFNASLTIAASTDLKEHILNNLHTAEQNIKVFGNLMPISSAPSLSAINSSIGFKLYGASDHDAETGSYLSTRYFVFFYIPVFPIGRFRVISIPNGYRFLGKVPLRKIDKWHLFISLGLMAMAVLYMIVNGTKENSSRSSTPSSLPSSNVTTSRPSTSNPYRNTLATEIENGKIRAKAMETKITEMDDQLESYKSRMRFYRNSSMTDEYNMLIPVFNTLVDERSSLYEEYSRLIEEINSKVNSYNSNNP